jgi:Tol biopolymer transport system component
LLIHDVQFDLFEGITRVLGNYELTKENVFLYLLFFTSLFIIADLGINSSEETFKLMNMKFCFFVLSVFITSVSFAQQNDLDVFQFSADIGNPELKGSTKYNATSQTYIIKGSGYNVWFNRDEFQYAYKKINGDFILTANFEFAGKGKDPHRKTGWMVRESTDEDAASINAVVHGDGLTSLQWRGSKGAQMRDPEDEISFPKKNCGIIQLERAGNVLTMRVANWGEPLQIVGSQRMENLPDSVLAGLFVSAHDSTVIEEVKVWNVRIDKPVTTAYNPDQDGWLGCRLEIINISDGIRKVIMQSPTRFEAPNWMPDGKKLLYNEGGALYTIPVTGGVPEKLNTDTVKRNNNDHGISFNGKLLAISSHRQGLTGGGSTVYVLPLEGGKPKLITQQTPSYWHGWHPNNKEVVFVGQRGGSNIYNLYKAAIADGKETQLSFNTTGHVDGPEYSPDGKYIYYNANPTGTMQIWRMKADGKEKEQITFDEYNNWFPHLSPDGKWMVFISFPPDIDPDSHPSYKRVTLRLMPVSGGAPKVIAYLYGGQGTINVPSWSPDSKQFAFVSNWGK